MFAGQYTLLRGCRSRCICEGTYDFRSYRHDLFNTIFTLQLSNEFKFPIAAFHHASEAYLVPDRIKQAYGKHTIRGHYLWKFDIFFVIYR